MAFLRKRNNDWIAKHNNRIWSRSYAKIGSGNANIVIGINADVPNANDNNKLNIGNTIYGNLATGLSA